MWRVTGKVLHTYCMYSLSKIKLYYRARLRNDLPISGWIQGCFATCGTITETPSIVVCSLPGRADHTYLDTVAQTACCQMVHFLFYSTD